MTAPGFPRGLFQPEGSYRFGLEALLLAAFAVRTLHGPARGKGRELRVAELGSGCGAALLGVALSTPNARCLGLEREPALVRAAEANAQALALAERVRFCAADFSTPAARATLEKEAGPQDLVLANPPWGLAGRGRASPSALRENALRGDAQDGGDAFPVFCAAAAALLRHRGAFCCIVPAQALTRICAALDGARLGLRRILPLRPRTREDAHRLLLHAQKHAAAEPRLLAPLTLHGRTGTAGGTAWTRAAMAFCPWLAETPPRHPGTPATALQTGQRGTP